MPKLDFVPTWTQVLAARNVVIGNEILGRETEEYYKLLATWPEDHPDEPLATED